jgi:hypothetical protein
VLTYVPHELHMRPIPIVYRNDEVRRPVEVHATGNFSLSDLREYVSQITKDPNFGPDLVMPVDFSGMEPRISSVEFIRYGKLQGKYPPYRKLAIIARSDLEFWIARIYASIVGTRGVKELQLFHGRKSA